MSITAHDFTQALLFIFPAYCANAAPVIFGGGFPIDGGRLFVDGKPLFGSHKTLRGFFSGLIVGILVSFIQDNLFRYNILLGFTLSVGAMIGDLAESFVKRRLNLPPGSTLPVADQLDFVLGALLFSLPVSKPPLPIVLIVIIITPPIHLLTNLLAYFLGVKKRIW